MFYSFILIPIIGALIGWGTNLLAIRMLFRPYRPIRIPLFYYNIQGLVPRHQDELAVKIGEAVEKDLLSGKTIIKHLGCELHKVDLAASISPIIKGRVLAKIPGFIPISFKAMLGNIIDEIISRETPLLVNSIGEKLSGKLEDSLDIRGLVEARVKTFSLPEMERIILDVAARELKHIEILGAILGFLIGLVQILILAISLN